ncbi:MAG: LON peptidase substrate-binding domain-containing protein [Alphaproteobacteria bacterium]|nr:LON peptidase substrate-binding domain-containing protein [Alphaproteobacteria bacterium]
MTENEPSSIDQAPATRESLPGVLPIFPLQGVLLLPGRLLPLNIFEPRYLNMVRDALAQERLIGMIQPLQKEAPSSDDHPDVYGTGCAGRITAFEETEDGRILITLVGVCRFDVTEELPLNKGYRQVRANYESYTEDLDEAEAAIDRPRLLAALRAYLDAQDVGADWDVIDKTEDGELVNALAMVCPFAPEERQMLLEAEDVSARARVMTALMEMTGTATVGDGGTKH